MSNNESFYTPPTLPNGDRDRRKEIEAWKRERNRGTAPLDLTVIVVIDNLLDALDEARKERDDAREQLVLRGRFDRAARMREEINSRTQ